MFQNNLDLRGHGEVVEMTKAQMEEWIKCSQDVFTFANYFNIIAEDGMHPIKLRPYQERLLRFFDADVPDKNNRIVMIGRQTGKTTLATLYLTWLALFKSDKTIAILANKEEQALEIMSRIRDAYVKLPFWLQQGINPMKGGFAKGTIGLDNGTKIFAAASSSSSIRGKTVDYMLVDEFAHLEPGIADTFMMSVFPTQSSRKDARLILISTPVGMNHFYDIWQKAVQGVGSFLAAKVQWYEIEGRDEAWKERIIRDTNPQFFAQEYACLNKDEKIKIKYCNNEVELTIKELADMMAENL